MFGNPPGILDPGFYRFLATVLGIGVLLGFGGAWIFRRKDSVTHVKGGCLLAPIALVGSVISILAANPECFDCPFTPDLDFIPSLAAFILPVAILLGIAVWHGMAIRGRGHQ